MARVLKKIPARLDVRQKTHRTRWMQGRGVTPLLCWWCSRGFRQNLKTHRIERVLGAQENLPRSLLAQMRGRFIAVQRQRRRLYAFLSAVAVLILLTRTTRTGVVGAHLLLDVHGHRSAQKNLCLDSLEHLLPLTVGRL